MGNESGKLESFEEFWPYYLAQHEELGTRQLHLAGTGVALASLAAFALTKRPAFLAAAFAGGYGPAWLAHAAIEGNKPATFTYPVWSLLADLRMFGLWAEGKLDGEISAQKRSAPATQKIMAPATE
jgi:hypothetical protein